MKTKRETRSKNIWARFANSTILLCVDGGYEVITTSLRNTPLVIRQFSSKKSYIFIKTKMEQQQALQESKEELLSTWRSIIKKPPSKANARHSSKTSHSHPIRKFTLRFNLYIRGYSQPQSIIVRNKTSLKLNIQ